MRRTFARILIQQMTERPEMHALVSDVGYGMFDAIAHRYPERFWNVGAAEQAMVGMGVGLALAGKLPICYTITPFLLLRPFELIRNYLNNDKVPVVLVGSGRDKDYNHDGPTHWCEEDRALLALLPNIHAWWPANAHELQECLPVVLEDRNPLYINLKR